MSLARIITRNPQGALAVSEYLRSEGYTVETVSPAEFRITPAELELDLSHCKKTEAVARAKAMVASRRDMAPVEHEAPAAPERTLPEEMRVPVAYDIVGRPVAFAGEEVSERQQGPRSRRNALASLLNRLTGFVRDFRQRRAEQQALRLKAGLARRREQALARERAQQEMERRRAEAELAEQRRREQVAAERLAEQQRAQAALVRQAGISAAPELAHQKQAEAAAPEGLPEPPQVQPVAVAVPRGKLAAARPNPARPFVARRRASNVILRRAAATALGAGLLLVLGFVAYANRRPASPLSPGALMMNGSINQEVPFGPVTIMPPTAVSKGSSLAAVPAKTSPVMRPATRASRGKPRPTAATARLKQDSETE